MSHMWGPETRGIELRKLQSALGLELRPHRYNIAEGGSALRAARLDEARNERRFTAQKAWGIQGTTVVGW